MYLLDVTNSFVLFGRMEQSCVVEGKKYPALRYLLFDLLGLSFEEFRIYHCVF